MSVLGSGSGTVYIVLTTTSAVSGIVYKPVRALTSRLAPPVRLLSFRGRLQSITLGARAIARGHARLRQGQQHCNFSRRSTRSSSPPQLSGVGMHTAGDLPARLTRQLSLRCFLHGLTTSTSAAGVLQQGSFCQLRSAM